MTTKHSLEKIVNISREIFKTCSLTDAFIEFPDGGVNTFMVHSYWSQLDIDKNERTKFQKTYLFEKEGNQSAKYLHCSKPLQIKSDIWNVKSPNNLKTAIINNWKDNGKEEQIIEIWDNQKRLESVNLTKLDKHGKIYENSSCLGSFGWSSDSTKIAYIAEIKSEAKEKCYFTSKQNSTDLDPIDEDNFEQKYANFYVDEWGEQYVGKSQSIISIFNLETLKIEILNKLPQDYTIGQFVWFKNEGLIISAYYTKPYRLGLIYCPIRRSELFYYDLINDTCTQLTDFKNQSVRDPQFSNDFEYLCWLQNPSGGPHFQCSKLMLMKWSTKETCTLVDIVRNNNSGSLFSGIFSIKFPTNCWSLDNKRIMLDTQCNKTNRIISVDIDTKQVCLLDNRLDNLNSINSLRISNDWICANLQGYNRRPSLIIGKLPERGNEANIEWIQIEKTDSLQQVASVESITLLPTNQDSNYPNMSFESILVQAKQQNNSLVLFPHGGPHSAFCSEFSAHVAIFYSLGYSVLLVNYRGSSGYGQDSIESLPGKVGSNDVNDCQQACEFAMKKYNFDKAFVYGGSHGGFLTTHLIGQFPDFYKAAAARNPVTNLEAMHHLTDIPDWVACEAFGTNEFNLDLFTQPNARETLFDKSPIKYVNNVKTPTLLMIGSVDLRVPPSQGLQYYKHLISRNVEAKLLTYKEDCHPLDRPQTTADCIVNTLLWYQKY